MRDYCFSAGRTSSSGRTTSSRSIRSNASQLLFQRKRTLDEFPMDHSLQDTHRLFDERRVLQAKQRQNLVTTNGESKQLSSYSRKRFETALTIKGEDSLPPPSPEEKTIFWQDVKPTWSYRRHVSMSAKPVTKHVELSPRPGSGPPGAVGLSRGGGGGGSPGGRQVFNHLRGNNSAYPTIRRLLQESNAEYRVVCPTPDCHYDRCRRPSLDCSSKSDFLLIPLEDELEEHTEEKEKEEEHTHRGSEERLHEEMLLMSKFEDVESIGGTRLHSYRSSHKEEKPLTPGRSRDKPSIQDTPISTSPENVIEDKERQVAEPEFYDSDEDNPASPWHCWVDDATVSSIASKKSDKEEPAADASPVPSPAPEMVVEQIPQSVLDAQKMSVFPGKANAKSTASPPKKSSSSTQGGKRKSAKGRRKGGKPIEPEYVVEEIIELPPPPPPPVVEEVVEEVKEEEVPQEPVLPSYICPSSVIKSTQAEIKLWMQKSTFSAANRLLPIY